MAHTGFNSRKGSRVFLDGQLYYALPVQFFSLGAPSGPCCVGSQRVPLLSARGPPSPDSRLPYSSSEPVPGELLKRANFLPFSRFDRMPRCVIMSSFSFI